MRGIDPRASRMLSERSTIWATPPVTITKFFGYLNLFQSATAMCCSIHFESTNESPPTVRLVEDVLDCGTPASACDKSSAGSVYSHRLCRLTRVKRHPCNYLTEKMNRLLICSLFLCLALSLSSALKRDDCEGETIFGIKSCSWKIYLV